MADHPNVGRVQRYLAAWTEPEADALLALCAEDAVMHVSGQHQVSGTYRGHDAMRVMYRKVRENSDGLEIDLDEVLAGDGHAVAILQGRLRRGDAAVAVNGVAAIKLNAVGKVTEAW